MKRKTLCLASVLAIWSTCGAAQPAGLSAPAGGPLKQIDIGASAAPLGDADRSDLDAAVRRHDYSAERTILGKARAQHPDSFDLLVLWGRLAYLESQPKDAVEALEAAATIRPLSEPDLLALAIAYQFSGKPMEARAELLKLVKTAPANAEYLYLLGRIDRVSQHITEAAENFANAIRINPNFVRAYKELAQAQETLGRLEEARQTYETAAAVNRRQSVPWEGAPLDLGIVLLRANDCEGAERLFREALQYNPRFAWGHYYLGQVFRQDGRNREALEEYRAAVADDPRLGEAWLAIGRELKREGKDTEANHALAIFKQLENQARAGRGRKD